MRYAHDEGLRESIAQRLEDFEVKLLDSGPGRTPVVTRAATARDGRLRQAAVAIAVLPDDQGESTFLLTRRASGLRRHGGQWALPGGRLDPGEGEEQAARRELEEELGVAHAAFDTLGRLDDFVTRSGFVISPLVFWSSEPQRLAPDPEEVAHAYRVPLGELDVPEAPILSKIPESDRPVLSMPLRGQKIHAPTAALLFQFLEVALRGRETRVSHYEQPVFAWR